MTLPLVPIAFAAIGVLLFGLASGKLADFGRLLLLAGLIALAIVLAGKTVHIG